MLEKLQFLDRYRWGTKLFRAITRHAGWHHILGRMWATVFQRYDMILRQLTFASLATVCTAMRVQFLNGYPFSMGQSAISSPSLQSAAPFNGGSTYGSSSLKVVQIPSLGFLSVNQSRMLRVRLEPSAYRSLTFLLILFSVGFGVLASSLWVIFDPLSIDGISPFFGFLVISCMVFSCACLALSSQSSFLGSYEMLKRCWQDGMTFSTGSHVVTFSTIAAGGQ